MLNKAYNCPFWSSNKTINFHVKMVNNANTWAKLQCSAITLSKDNYIHIQYLLFYIYVFYRDKIQENQTTPSSTRKTLNCLLYLC